MNGQPHDRLDNDKGKIQYDADDKGPVDVFQIYGMVVVTEAMAVTMIVIPMAVTMVMMVVAMIVVTMCMWLCHTRS